MDLKDKKVLVIGTGLSGIGSAELLVKKGAHVLLLEQNEKADLLHMRDFIAHLFIALTELIVGIVRFYRQSGVAPDAFDRDPDRRLP